MDIYMNKNSCKFQLSLKQNCIVFSQLPTGKTENRFTGHEFTSTFIRGGKLSEF